MPDFDGQPNLGKLLNKHGLSPSGWVELAQRGFSGARIYKKSDEDGASHVVKVTSVRSDWIMRATGDERCREAVLANLVPFPGGAIRSPAIESAEDGDVFSVLMHDISDCLLPNAMLGGDQLAAILSGMGHLHSTEPPRSNDMPWCSIESRLTLFKPDPEKLAGFRIAEDILRGWALFFQYAPRDVADLIRALFIDIGPLERALAQLPPCFLHGDLKLDNIGIRPDGTLCLIDWSMPMVAPAAIELGWFLAMNSKNLPVSLDETIAAYASISSIEERLRERHRCLTVLCGLMIRGWRKGLDAQAGDATEFLWWCEHASTAARML